MIIYLIKLQKKDFFFGNERGEYMRKSKKKEGFMRQFIWLITSKGYNDYEAIAIILLKSFEMLIPIIIFLTVFFNAVIGHYNETN